MVFLAGYVTAPGGGEGLTSAVAVVAVSPPEAAPVSPGEIAAVPPEAAATSPGELVAAVGPGEIPAAPGSMGLTPGELAPGTSLGIAGEEGSGAEATQPAIDLTLAYKYNPAGKVDPFAPLVRDEKPELAVAPTGPATQQGDRPRRKPPTITTPLQRFDLSQLRLTAVIRRPDLATAIAMVEDPAGKGYKVEKGTLIGKDFGQVTAVLSDRVIVEEEKEDIMGNLTTRTQELVLEKAAGDQL